MDEVYDIRAAMAPKSDQLNADDLIGGPATVTITGINLSKVTGAKGEQPLSVVIDGGFKPWKPCKSMMRVLSSEWGTNAAKWIGRRVTLYRDPGVKFGGDAVGGIRISHMSHIQKRTTLALTVTRGQKAPYSVEPLPSAASGPTRDSGTNPYTTFTATLAAAKIDAEAVGEWYAATYPQDGHPRDWVRGLPEFAADLLAPDSVLMADFRKFAGGGGK